MQIVTRYQRVEHTPVKTLALVSISYFLCDYIHHSLTPFLPSPKDVLKFDNSYSWTRAKEVFYSVKVLPPGTDPPPMSPMFPEHVPSIAADSDDEFHDCADDTVEPEDATGGLLDKPVPKTSLTADAEVMEVDGETEGAIASMTNMSLQDSIQTTV